MKELTVVTRGYTRSERHVALLARDEHDAIVAGVIVDVLAGDVARRIGRYLVEGLEELGYTVVLSRSAREIINYEENRQWK